MSDLKHMTVVQLREEIASISKWRANKEVEATGMEDRAERLRKEADSEEAAATELRRRSHNMGQREAWARIFLAQKS